MLAVESSVPLSLQTVVSTDDMDLAGDIVQSLAAYFSIEVCRTPVTFPKMRMQHSLVTTPCHVAEMYNSRALSIGYFGAGRVVLCREVVLFSEVLVVWEWYFESVLDERSSLSQRVLCQYRKFHCT